MAALDDLDTFYDVANGEAELVTVQGVPNVPAIFDEASEVVLGDAVVQAPVLRLARTVAAVEDGLCVVRGLSYKIRNARPLNSVEQQLVLVRV